MNIYKTLPFASVVIAILIISNITVQMMAHSVTGTLMGATAGKLNGKTDVGYMKEKPSLL